MDKHLQNYIVTNTPQKYHAIPADVLPSDSDDIYLAEPLWYYLLQHLAIFDLLPFLIKITRTKYKKTNVLLFPHAFLFTSELFPPSLGRII